jgi:hypothetical protein
MTWKLPDGTILSTSSAAQQQPAVTLATPTPDEQREAAIATLVQAMTQAGVSQEDAEKVAPVLVDGSAEPETP